MKSQTKSGITRLQWRSLIVAVGLLLGTQIGAQAQWFSSTSFWRTKIVEELPSADQSDAVRIGQQFLYTSDPAPGVQAVGIARTTYDKVYVPEHVPVWTVTSGQATTDLNSSYSWGQNVPWPSVAYPNTADTDLHSVLWQPSTNKMWEFWHTDVISSSPVNVHADWGGYIANVTTNSGIIAAPNGAAATGLPLVGGMITLADAAAITANPTSTGNLIPHVLCIACPEIAFYHVAPANRHDNVPAGNDYRIPEGRRFKLPANVSITTTIPLLKAAIIAARDYGIVVRDGTGATNPIVFYRERRKTGIDPTTAWDVPMNGKAGYDVFNSFPFSQLQALNPLGHERGVVDNDPGCNGDGDVASSTGTWTQSTGSSSYGTDNMNDGNTGKGTKTFTFTPNLQGTGTYSVYMRWTAHANRATNVPVNVHHAGGIDAVSVNQQLNDATWVLLGTYTCNAGTGHKVVISTTGTNGYVVADAVKFERILSYEGEDLAVSASSGDVLGDYANVLDSGGYFTNMASNAIGDYVTYTVNVPTAGKYRVKVTPVGNTNRGIYQLSIDGVNQGPTVDVYTPAPSHGVVYDLGTKTFLTSGNKAFKFTVTGKNAASTSYYVSTDVIKLTSE